MHLTGAYLDDRTLPKYIYVLVAGWSPLIAGSGHRCAQGNVRAQSSSERSGARDVGVVQTVKMRTTNGTVRQPTVTCHAREMQVKRAEECGQCRRMSYLKRPSRVSDIEDSNDRRATDISKCYNHESVQCMKTPVCKCP